MSRRQTRNFRGRKEQHEAAMRFAQDKFAEHGFTVRPYGFEDHNIETVKLLQFKTDPTSLAARFKPDQLAITNKGDSFLCEVKSEADGRKNFAVEVDSFTGAKMHARAGYRVMYFYADLSTKPYIASCCWIEDAYGPRNILVPTRFNFDLTQSRLIKIYPYAFFNVSETKSGSGTPYYLIPKDGFRLTPFDEFIKGNSFQKS